jgi:hypothetical protein
VGPRHHQGVQRQGLLPQVHDKPVPRPAFPHAIQRNACEEPDKSGVHVLLANIHAASYIMTKWHEINSRIRL